MSGSMAKYIIDASSIFKLLSSAFPNGQNLLENSSITNLTLFEIGNVLYKRKDSSIKEMPVEKVMALSKVIGNIIREITRLPITATEIPNILSIAINKRTTFYDASYIYVCSREKLSLISEDIDLRRKAGEEKIKAYALMDVQPDQ
jgi:predicted nucleic acid-binding protein